MSHKWPDLSDYNAKVLLIEINGQQKVGFFPLGDSESLDVDDVTKKSLSDNNYYHLSVNDQTCYVKDSKDINISEIARIFPEYLSTKKLMSISDVSDILVKDPSISFAEDKPVKYTIKGFNQFMMNELTPKDVREKHVECITALLEVVDGVEELKQIQTVTELKEKFIESGGNPEFVKRKRLECAFPFFREYVRRVDLGLDLDSSVQEDYIDHKNEVLSSMVEEFLNMNDVNRPNDFINLFQRNIYISGAKTIIDFIVSDKANQAKFKNLFSSSDDKIEDLRFSMISDKQRIHYKSPVLTSLKKAELNASYNLANDDIIQEATSRLP